MKYLTIILALLTTSVMAQETPKYLKDAVITVTLKNGKTYTYSANEYAVIKRQSEVDKLVAELDKLVAELEKVPTYKADGAGGVTQTGYVLRPKEQQKGHKHIISGEVLSSRNGGLKDSSDPSQVKVKTERKIGVGLMYQNNIYKDLYLGGRVDTNGGAGVNIGVGF